jgi:dienelactone hydrolase
MNSRILPKLYTSFCLILLTHFCLFGEEATRVEYFEVPKPTGAYNVGTQVFYLTDYSRIDPETNKSRQLVMQAWYPTAGKLDKPLSPYAYEAIKVWKRDLLKEGYTEAAANNLDLIRTYAVSDAPVLFDKDPYPVIIFGHGYGMARGLYSTLCEEMASHGYVVCMVMHTYAAELTRFADGTETEVLRKRSLELVMDCFRDVEFMMDSVQKGALNELTRLCDFKNIGMVGHSLGGVIAPHVCREDSRVKAGISLDGPLWGVNATEPLHKSFMFMIAPTFYEMFGDEEAFVFSGMATQEQFINSLNLEVFCQKNDAPSYRIILKDAEHNIFSDAAIWVEFLEKILREEVDLDTGKIDGMKAIEITRAYICGFFDKYLKEKPNNLFDKENKTFSSDIEFSSWVK